MTKRVMKEQINALIQKYEMEVNNLESEKENLDSTTNVNSEHESWGLTGMQIAYRAAIRDLKDAVRGF